MNYSEARLLLSRYFVADAESSLALCLVVQHFQMYRAKQVDAVEHQEHQPPQGFKNVGFYFVMNADLQTQTDLSAAELTACQGT